MLTATCVLVAQQYAVPSASFWNDLVGGRGYLIAILVTVIAAFGALTPAQIWSERSQMARRTAVRHQILNHFGRLLAIASRVDPKPSASDLGLHVWRVTWSLRRPRRRLIRIATYRLGSTPATRTFEPGRGVGVVGLCWKRNEEVAVDVERLAGKLTTHVDYDEYATAEGADAVMNLAWPEFARVRHRGAVFASPIRNGRGEFIGCVSVDASSGFATLANDELWHELNSLCMLLGDDGLLHV
ncbi:hypothetical protein C1I93_03330 [Micromonospora endophytica]|uniref:GAF domain-containing protein n=2 Tax=Micromonospora endophytica TaxID=515350 RepID=A0A2W2CNM6_9ACTN|nr:hypothetical protein C1I93_03330 [Micromonospora endophytica]RIW47981.1 hypothetical protein D3H59_08930 [Micromonospora endophytica]